MAKKKRIIPAIVETHRILNLAIQAAVEMAHDTNRNAPASKVTARRLSNGKLQVTITLGRKLRAK